jgi:phosphorylcholine metabolism protein LicD
MNKVVVVVLVVVTLSIVLVVSKNKEKFTVLDFVEKCKNKVTGGRIKNHLTSKEEMNAMNDILKIMDKYLRKYKVDYFIKAGTLIGALRNKPSGVLYWDDDVDVGVFKKDVPKINEMLKDPEFLKQVDFKKHSGFGYQMYPKSHRKLNSKDKKEYIYDIFIYEEGVDKYSIINKMFPHAYIPDLGYVYPIKYDTFWDMKLPYPNKAKELLEISYGKDVMKTAKYYNHKMSKGSEDVQDDNTIPLHIKHATFLKN